MNAETKRHIDTARQILVGVVPNPASQVDQITNALIYKFMDDMDQEAIKTGGDPSFFIGNLENYAWTCLMDTRMGNQERMNLYSEALLKFSEAKQLPELFRNIFKSAFLPYRSPEVLGLFLKEINYFNYSHTEELGDAYEHLLSIMASQGDAGQFLTPRHIIEFIVNVVNPTKTDKVLDPACGTGGFLIKAYEHILKQHDGKDDPEKKEKPLTPDERKTLMNNFEGYDIDPGMVRITQVNTYLHQFKNPKVYQYDTLSSDERWNDKFDVILANPPFMSPKGGIKPHNKFSIQSSRSEVLFVDYIMSHLKPNGRAGIIVPEGIIFQSGTAYKQLRKSLVEDGLYAVVSLPSGVFHPYAGVKTSILFFNNARAKQRSKILFVKVENDGFDLGAQRRPIDKNNLPEALEVLNKWEVGEESKSKLALYVEKSKITENDNYNLSGDHYRVVTDYTNAKWPMVELRAICEFVGKGGRPASFATENGKIPFIVSSSFEKKCDSADFDTEALIIGDGGSANIHYINGRFSASDHTYVLKNKSEETVSLKCVCGLILNNLEIIEKGFQGQGLKNVSKKYLQSIQIPLPPLEIQEQIVTELDGYKKIVVGAKQITKNWKPKIDIDPKWEKVKLEEISDLITKGTTPTTNGGKFTETGVNFIKVESLSETGEIDFKKTSFISEKCHESLKRSQLKENDLLFSIAGTKMGISAIVTKNVLPANTNQALAIIRLKNNIDPLYILNYLRSIPVISLIENIKVGVAQFNLSLKQVAELEIPLPPHEIQKQTVEKIEAERALVESAKKLIEIYEQKTKDVVIRLWGK